MMALGRTIKQMVKEFTHIQMEQSTMDPGKKINNMVRALRLGQMVLLMMDFTKKGENMAQGNSLGLTVALIKGNFTIIILKGKVNINGVINEFITETG